MTPTRSIRHGSTSTVLAPAWGSLIPTVIAAMLLPLGALVLLAHPWLALAGLAGLLVRPTIALGGRLCRVPADALRAPGPTAGRGTVAPGGSEPA